MTGEAGRAARSVRAAERAFDAVFGLRANPLRQLGALAFWMLWIVVASGLWIYVLYDTSVAGAWRSVNDMTEHQPWAAGLMRSLHRYASDALIVLTTLHLLREALLGRFRRFRWFSWVSGVPLLPLAIASGIVGYWMVWDQRALATGVALFEWFAQLPGFGLAMVRNFIDPQAVTDRFFSLLAFTHIGLPLLLLLGAWAHLLRLARPQTQPAAPLAVGSLLALLALALLWPARSMALADVLHWPARIDLDWFTLGVLPLAEAAPIFTWLALVLGIGALLAMPWLPGAPPTLPVAVVDPAHCNGCTWCFADCPYGAITMVPHPNARAGARLAQVDADLCAGCGVCVGACPSATPFRRGAPLATGIDLPAPALATLRARLDDALDALDDPEATKVVVLGCDSAARLDDAPPGTVMLTAPCTAQWPPVFIEYALRRGVDGVLVTGCPPGDCQWRLGARWVEQRMAGQRMPQLRSQVPRERVRLHWALTGSKADLLHEVQAFHRALAALSRPRVPEDA